MVHNNATRRRLHYSSHSSEVNFTIKISAGFLPDGRVVDFIRDVSTGKSKLIVFDGAQIQALDSIQIADQTFVPPALDSAIQRAITLPTEPVDYGSTELLFTAALEVLSGHGMSQEVATASIYFALATWFPERSLPMPCLMITGPGAEAHLLLELLGCLVRRGLPMLEIDSHGFCGVVDTLHPTVLMDARYLTPRGLRLLAESCRPGTYLPRNGSVSGFSFAKALYLGTASVANFSADFAVHLHLSPSLSGVPVLNEEERHQIIADLQPKFLDYRLRNLDRVRASDFDLHGMDSESRIIGRLLGGCIVDAPDIQARVQVLLREHDNQLRASRWTNLTCVVIEVLLSLCHGKPTDIVHVKEIALATEVALKCRGEAVQLKPRKIGTVLDDLGLFRERDPRGYRIRLASEVQRKIHLLARDHQVESIRDGAARCAYCHEILGNAGDGMQG
jgi:hypothetical protein